MGKMIFGIYQKHIKYCKNGCVFSFYSFDTKHTYTLVGNVPKIENKSGATTKSKSGKKKAGSKQGVGMVISVALKDDFDIVNHYYTKNMLEVTDYNISKTDKNVERLKTLGYVPDDFFEDVRFHQKTGLLWRNLSKSRVPYKYFDFDVADNVYKKIGGFYESDTRLSAINEKIISEFRNNDRYFYSLEEYLKMFRRVESTGSFAKVSHKAILSYFVKHNEFFFDGEYVWDREIKDATTYIKNRFTQCGFSNKAFVPVEKINEYIEEHPELSDEQKDCLRNLATDNITIITGGAGTGKTTVIKSIIETYNKHFSTGSLLLAPTGKASRRIAVKCDNPAYTIHHALRKSLENDYIHYRENNPFPEQLFVVDESSMIDTLLMRDILRAISLGSKVIFVGDYQQLEAVGVGSPFHEMIESGLCKVIKLTKNFRQSDDNAILNNAEAVLNGEMFFEGNGVTIHEISLSELSKYASEDTVNISPYRKIVSAINQSIYNKHKEDTKFQNEYYYKGCQVVFNKNTEHYANGDTGRVLTFDDESMKIVLDDTYEVITVNREDFDNMNFGYALTTHKVQGSEYDNIKIFLPKELTSFSANPNMLYTMITRARKNVDIYYYSE